MLKELCKQLPLFLNYKSKQEDTQMYDTQKTLKTLEKTEHNIEHTQNIEMSIYTYI